MKKKNVVLCAGILSMVMLVGCGTSTSNETGRPATQEVTETSEAEDSTIENEEKDNSTEAESHTAFSSLMTEIYEVKTDSASAETVAENLKKYAFTYGAPSSSSVFETLANDWFLAIEETEGNDVRSEFSECFHTVTSTAQEMDETLEYDLAYTNVVEGILRAIGE